MIHLLDTAKGTEQYPSLSLTLPVLLGLLDNMVQEVEHPEQQPGPVEVSPTILVTPDYNSSGKIQTCG